MDIAYLLWLQGLREALPGFVEQFFVIVSAIAASKALILLPCVLYWILDKRAGQYIVFSFTIATLFNQLIKNTVCAYRPWIRDAAIHPTEAALPEATGYSFPSGHVTSASTVIGALGWHYRKRWRGLCIGCWIFVVLTALSRNFLGVHTPQDVLVGLVEGIAFVLLMDPLLDWIDEVPGRDRTFFIAAIVVVVAYVAFVQLKPYPMDYTSSGEVLVDPEAMKVDCFKSAGAFGGAMLGWFLERRFVSFESDPHMGAKRVAVRVVLGTAVVVLFHVAPSLLHAAGMADTWYELIKNFTTIFAAVFVAPALFCAVERRLAA